ncbi:MAG: hypothetical protein HY370_09760 [Proteobacteria bacterium]|nr:hypothetical protein [Pseudomonadota bacterium]
MGARLNGHLVVLSERSGGMNDDAAALRNLTDEIADPAFKNLHCLKRVTALEKIAARGDADPDLAFRAAKALLSQVYDDDPMIRNAAAHETVGLCRKFQNVSLPAFLSVLLLSRDESEANRVMAARHAGFIAIRYPAYPLPVMILLDEMKEDPSASVRQQVFHCLANIAEARPEHSEYVQKTLQEAAKDPVPAVAASALHRLYALRTRQGMDDNGFRDSFSFDYPRL